MYCLTSVMGLFMSTKANLRLLFFFPLWYESLGWCVVGRWNNSVDNICLSAGFDPTGVRPWLDAPPLSPYLSLRGPTQDRWPSFFFFLLFFAPPWLQVSGGLFVPCAGRMQAVGWGTILCSQSREETARSELSVISCKGTTCYLCFQPCVDVYLCIHVGRKKKTI